MKSKTPAICRALAIYGPVTGAPMPARGRPPLGVWQRGAMIWPDHMGWYAQPVVYVLHADSTYQRFADTFDAAVDPIGGGETAPNGLVEPIYGFGKVWLDEPGVACDVPGCLIAYAKESPSAYYHIYGRLYWPEAVYLPLVLSTNRRFAAEGLKDWWCEAIELCWGSRGAREKPLFTPAPPFPQLLCTK